MINPFFFGLLSFLRALLSILRLSYPLGINNNIDKLKINFSAYCLSSEKVTV